MKPLFHHTILYPIKPAKRVLRYWLSLWIGLGLLSVMPGAVQAQKPAPNAPNKVDQTAAKEAYIEAKKLYKAEEFGLALPLFEKAYRLSGKKPVSILALAQCERALKLYDQALARFNEYKATQTDPKQIKRTNETVKILVQLAAKAKQEAEAEKKKKAEEKKAMEAALVKKLEADARLRPPPAPPLVSPAQAPEKKSDSILASPWFWMGVAAIAAAGTGVGVILSQTGEPAGNVSSTGETLRL